MSNKGVGLYEYDMDTGDITSMEPIPEGYEPRVISKKSIEAFKHLQNDMLDIHSEDSYSKQYPRFMAMVVELGLDNAEKEIFQILQSFCVKYGSGLIIHENNVPVRGAHIIEKTKLSEKTCYAALRSLGEKGVIARERKGRNDVYFMNPFIIEHGNEISVELLSRFQDTIFAKAAVSRIIKKKRKT